MKLSARIFVSMMFMHVGIGLFAQMIPAGGPHADFIANRGQWDDKIQFTSCIPGGQLYLENGLLTYVFYSQEDMNRIHGIRHGKKGDFKDKDLIIRGHLFRMKFKGANKMVFEGEHRKSNYYNYFIGNDPERWAGNVPAYGGAFVNNVWDGIDYRIYSSDINLKYDFIVNPGGDVSKIAMKFDYLDKIYVRNDNLHFETSVNRLTDMKPRAYQKAGDKYIDVPCRYELNNDIVTFSFPNGYDHSRELVIDPKLIFSSYTGASRDNWGFTATFDESGNLYGAGIVFSSTSSTQVYPTTTGAFQTTFGGGGIDIGISKFNATGTNLLYSTYLGGLRNEIPHSLVVNSKNQLIVMGTTSSTDYPVTANAFDTSYNISGTGSITVAQTVTYIGCDIVLSKFSASGSALLGSTYIGGTGYDGVNYNSLEYNYGDDVRGEVVVDKSDNVYVASTTASTNFPITNGSGHKGGVQDAIVFKLDSSLSTLIWSTYIGGNGNDAAYSVQVDDYGKAYVAGGTASSNFPTTAGALHTNALGGTDGFVSIVNSNGSTLYASTRLGTSKYDQAYFVQLDDSNFVYVTGQTEGTYPIWPPGVYGNPYSGQFIHKLTNDLDSTKFTTVFGTPATSGSGVAVDISLSAFLVDHCGHIYVSGWGGDINSVYSSATSSTTTGLPVTTGAHKTSTDGNDFYLIVLDRNADSLLYATFFGGTSGYLRGEHVDGGTSRFDKRGIVYQAVCAGCGNSNSFPTYPSNVWSTTNGSYNCNLGVIKFDLSQLISDIGLDALTKVCIPGAVVFNNTSSGGTNYFWDFGDGNTSTAFQPTHTYINTGTYTVTLIVSDSLSCLVADTSYITVKGEAPPNADILPVQVICPGDSVQLVASGGLTYKWSPNLHLSNDTIPNPFANPLISTTYSVTVGDSCGSDTNNLIAYDTAQIDVIVATDLTSAIPSSDTICKGNSVQLTAAGGQAYNWVPPTYLNKPNIPNPVSTPDNSITYTVEITDFYNCKWTQIVKLRVENPIDPEVISSPDTTICLGDTILLFSSGGTFYEWQPASLTSDSAAFRTEVWPTKNTTFIVKIRSKCFATQDTVEVKVVEFSTTAMADTFACPDVPIRLSASPGVRFNWSPEDKLDDPSKDYPYAVVREAITYAVEAFDAYGCAATDSVFINLRPEPYLSAGNDRVIQGNATQLEARGNGKFEWEPRSLVKCADCPITDAYVPFESVLFRVKLTDKFGCTNSDQVLVYKLSHNLFVPNSFTPNSDNENERFRPYGYNVEDFEMIIYNRWGEIVFITRDFEGGWDGTLNGQDCPNGTYVWQIKCVQNGEPVDKIGTVSLIR